MKTIEVTISPNGEVKTHVKGVHGESCVDITKGLEEALGGAPIIREFTPEYDDQSVEQTNDQQLTA